MQAMTPNDTPAATSECESCGGLNTSCPGGCGRDLKTGELDASTASWAGKDYIADNRDTHDLNEWLALFMPDEEHRP